MTATQSFQMGDLSEAEADQFMRDGDWYAAKCGRCGASLERGGGPRPRESRRLDICCFDCLYVVDRVEMLANGGILRCGTSFVTSAMLRRDFEIYQPHFDAECILTPTLQGLWARYRNQPALNDRQYKRAILVDSATGTARSAYVERSHAWRSESFELNAAVRPLATSRIWEQAEKDMRKQLLDAYRMEGLV